MSNQPRIQAILLALGGALAIAGCSASALISPKPPSASTPSDTKSDLHSQHQSSQTPPNILFDAVALENAQQRLQQPPDDYPLTHAAYQDIKRKADRFQHQVQTSPPPVYTGTRRDDYRQAATTGLTPSLYTALVCVIEEAPDHCQTTIDTLLAWAEADGGTQVGQGHRDDLIGAGLDIGRLFHYYAQAFQLVAPQMSPREQQQVQDWFLALGQQIQTSHRYWLRHLSREGANNHLSRHLQGMLIAALYGEDDELLDYVLDDSPWNYANLVRDAIYEEDNPDNLFRANRDFSHLPIQAQTGEIYDRHRSLPHPPAQNDIYNRHRWWDEDVTQGVGFAYSVFHLEGLILTAHMAELNGLQYPEQRLMDVENQSIRNALRFYGQYYLDYPWGEEDCRDIEDLEPSPDPYDGDCPIAYEPYFGENPKYHTLYLFLLAKDYYPEDAAFYEDIIAANETMLIPQGHPLHSPASVFTFIYGESHQPPAKRR
jgi:hypothetical protein